MAYRQLRLQLWQTKWQELNWDVKNEFIINRRLVGFMQGSK